MSKYIIFSIFFLIQYLCDRTTTYCNTFSGEVILIFHHLLGVYIYLGGFLFNKLYHLIIISFILIHWIKNNNKCQLTIITNKLCGYEKEHKYQDLYQKLNIEKIFKKNIQYYFLAGLIIYDIYGLIKN